MDKNFDGFVYENWVKIRYRRGVRCTPSPATQEVGQTKEKKDDELWLEELRKKYEEKFDKPVANNKKNDAEWIASKL